MENVADGLNDQQLWACVPAEDLRRTAELARRVFGPCVSAILSLENALPIIRYSTDPTASEDLLLRYEEFAAAEPSELWPSKSALAIFAPLAPATGGRLGAIVVLAPEARDWTAVDRGLLGDLAAQLTSQIELRHDLARKTQAREAYADTRAKLLAVADRIPGLVFERRKLDAGRSAYTFFGSGKIKLPAVRQMMTSGIAGLDFVHRDDRDTVRAAILRSNLEETDLDLTFRIKDLDRSVRWIRSQSIVRRDPDGTVCWDGLCFDITDIVGARDEAEAARSARDAMLLDIGREFRDPARAIVRLAQAVKTEDGLDQAHAQVDDIEAVAQAMAETADRLLDQAEIAPRPAPVHEPTRTDPRPAVSPAKAEGSPTLGGARILLADDLDLNRKLIADMLSYDGHLVDGVADGAEAVRAAREQAYDLILMDMIMPGMDGIAATKAIRNLPSPASKVPIVALTANSAQEQLESCLQAGMDAALTKPMSMEALLAAVAIWTRGRKAA